ncbi:hypothetical protein RYX36_027163, partial [Vicia faba]
MIGGRQYFVHPGRWLIVQRLKGAKVNDKISLHKVLLVGTNTSCYIGKPVVANVVVYSNRKDRSTITEPSVTKPSFISSKL